jgi:hypothetical protein
MRHVVALFVAIACVTSQAAVFPGRTGGAASGAPAMRACSILTKDLAAPFAENKKVLDLIPPTEEALGSSGAACQYGAVRLQLYPIARSQQKRTPPKDMQPIAGAGEAAYFRNNRDRYAELMVWTATHYFTLQVNVPTGKTAETIRPDTIALANAVIAKLR